MIDRRRVGIPVFPEVEVLDFAGPFEVSSVTRLDEERRREEPPRLTTSASGPRPPE